jgi:hypothetical protein
VARRLELHPASDPDCAINFAVSPNESGHLGRWYMAHLERVAANVQFTTTTRSTIYGYERDIDRVYIRRRFAFTQEFQQRHHLPNITRWITNPDAGRCSTR